MHVNETDRELIEAYLAHSNQAIADVSGLVEKAALPFRRKLQDQWQDVLQDVHLKLWDLFRNGRFSGSGSLTGYIIRVTAHTCLDRLRYGKRWCQKIDQFAKESRPPSPTPMTVLLEKLTFETVQKIYRAMPQECRDLWRFIFEGKSYEEMSQQLGIRPATLRIKVLRCRQKAIAMRDEENVQGKL